jgi:hypothetical protein
MVTVVLVVAFISLAVAVGRRVARRSRGNGAPDSRWYPDQNYGQTQGPSGHHGGHDHGGHGGHHGGFGGGHDHGGFGGGHDHGGFSGGHDHGGGFSGGDFGGGGHH